VITDSTNWVTLVDTITADSMYTHLLAGGFLADSSIDTPIINMANLPLSYYYVDSIVVAPIVPAGITEMNRVQFVSVYPNPLTATSEVSFSNPLHVAYSFGLYNAHGQQVSVTNNITSDKFIIHRNDLPAGFYYYRLTSQGNKETYTGRLVIN